METPFAMAFEGRLQQWDDERGFSATAAAPRPLARVGGPGDRGGARRGLKNCPGAEMDGNHDGVPCEQQWCGAR
jgi:hypothetical protein